MTLSSDHEIVQGSRWSRKSKMIAFALSLPLLAYAPGLVLALPQGVATSLPFWGEAPDYTCSSTAARSLMVRVSPYGGAQKSAKRTSGSPAQDCVRIKSFAASDLVGGDPRAPDDGHRYVRIYTPSHAERAILPEFRTPDDMSSRVVSLRPQRPNIGSATAGAPMR